MSKFPINYIHNAGNIVHKILSYSVVLTIPSFCWRNGQETIIIPHLFNWRWHESCWPSLDFLPTAHAVHCCWRNQCTENSTQDSWPPILICSQRRRGGAMQHATSADACWIGVLNPSKCHADDSWNCQAHNHRVISFSLVMYAFILPLQGCSVHGLISFAKTHNAWHCITSSECSYSGSAWNQSEKSCHHASCVVDMMCIVS